MQPTNSVQTEMCILLECSIEKYRNIMYKYGLAYLQWYLPCSEIQRRKLESSQIYWAWFRTQWEMHDQSLLDDSEFYEYSTEDRRRFFSHLHEPQAMAIDIKPNAVVLAELNKKEVVYG